MIKAIYDVNIRFTGKGEIRMKKKKNLLCFVLLISLIFTMAFGSVTVSAAPKLNRTKVTLLKGEKTTLKVTGTRQKVAWRSSKKECCDRKQQRSGGCQKIKVPQRSMQR